MLPEDQGHYEHVNNLSKPLIDYSPPPMGLFTTLIILCCVIGAIAWIGGSL
jgi:hypothetical protein